MLQPPPHRIPPRPSPPLTPRERVLSQWKGIDIPATEKAHGLHAKKMGDLVPKVSAILRLDKRLGEAEIVKVWNNSIEPEITDHAQPASFNSTTGTLFVNVDNSVWLSEIVRYRRRDILNRLQNSFGTGRIKKLSFRLG